MVTTRTERKKKRHRDFVYDDDEKHMTKDSPTEKGAQPEEATPTEELKTTPSKDPRRRS